MANNKQLIIAEDIEPGFGSIQQVRNSGEITVTKINGTHLKGLASVATMSDRDALDTSLLGGDKLILVMENSNVYSYNGTEWKRMALSGQFADQGTNIGSCIQYMAQVSAEGEQIVIPEGTNAFAIESFELAEGATLTVPPGSVFKVL